MLDGSRNVMTRLRVELNCWPAIRAEDKAFIYKLAVFVANNATAQNRLATSHHNLGQVKNYQWVYKPHRG